jgi:hypothetical protein
MHGRENSQRLRGLHRVLQVLRRAGYLLKQKCMGILGKMVENIDFVNGGSFIPRGRIKWCLELNRVGMMLG